MVKGKPVTSQSLWGWPHAQPFADVFVEVGLNEDMICE